MITQEQIDARAILIHKAGALEICFRLARIELTLEQKEEKSFEDWWLSYRIPVDYDINEVARAAWNAARGK